MKKAVTDIGPGVISVELLKVKDIFYNLLFSLCILCSIFHFG